MDKKEEEELAKKLADREGYIEKLKYQRKKDLEDVEKEFEEELERFKDYWSVLPPEYKFSIVSFVSIIFLIVFQIIFSVFL